MYKSFEIFPIGMIRKDKNSVFVEIYDCYRDGLLKLEDFSHILIFFWFNKRDKPEDRRVLRVHPRGNPDNPLSGVFATRSPRRPNPIAISTCKILSVEGNLVYIEDIDAFDSTPVVDIKPYLKHLDPDDQIKVPTWIKKQR